MDHFHLVKVSDGVKLYRLVIFLVIKKGDIKMDAEVRVWRGKDNCLIKKTV